MSYPRRTQRMPAPDDRMWIIDQNNYNQHSARSIHLEEDKLPVVASLEFWERYDSLWESAAALESAQDMLQEAIQQREEQALQLEHLQAQFRQNRAFAKEQMDRIDLVTHHWFFGTTVFQPQLWIRGGCPGKAYRARAKLAQCDAEFVPLLQRVERLQTIQLASLQQAVQEGQEQVTASRTSIAVRESMQEQVWTEYPSSRLMNLQCEAASLKEEVCIHQEHVERLDEAFRWYGQATQQYQQAKEKLQQAQGQYDQYAHLLQRKELEEDTCRNTTVLCTDINDNTGKCANVSRYPAPISSPPPHGLTPCEQQLEACLPKDNCSWETWKARQEQNDREIQRTLDLCQELFHQGQEHLKRGNKMLQQAMAAIPLAVQTRFRDTPLSAEFTTITNTKSLDLPNPYSGQDWESDAADPLVNYPPSLTGALVGWILGGPLLAALAGFGTAYYTAWNERWSATRKLLREDDQLLPRTLEVVTEWQQVSQQQVRMIQQWKEEILHEIVSTQSNLDRINSELIPHERDRIWRAMRARFVQERGRYQPPQPHGAVNETWYYPSTIATTAMAPVVPIIAFETSYSTSETPPPPSAPAAVMVEETESNQVDDAALSTYYRPPAYAPTDCHHYHHHDMSSEDSATSSWSTESHIYSLPPPSLSQSPMSSPT